MRTPTTVLIALLTALPAALGAQQNLFPEASIIGGVEARSYSFGNGFTVDRIRQVAVPLGVIVPVGKRFSFDIGSSYAVTSVKDATGASHSFSGLTDTQIRGSYVFGTDALVASLMVNIPTGVETTTLSKFGITSAASSNFLLFPVNSYGSGFSVTPGLAAATTAGNWNLGLAGSVRMSAKYTPFSDDSNFKSYKPGLETRLRAGADRLLGSSRLSVGFTFSTFSNDQFSGATGNGVYDPGNRFLVDASLQAAAGSGTVTFFAWDYFRTSSSSSSSATSNRENVLTLGSSGSFPLGGKLSLEPLAEARIWSPKTGSGLLVGGGTSLRIELSPKVALVPGARVDFGTIKSPDVTAALKSHSITSWDVSALVRVGF